MQDEDTEEQYRRHLAALVSKTKSRGHSRYYNRFLNKCRAEAAAAYPKGQRPREERTRELVGC